MKHWLLMLGLLLCATASAQMMQDPTRPPKASPVEAELNDEEGEDQEAVVTGIPRAVLTAIYVTDSNRYAIINNDIVFEGDSWKNVVVKEVNLDNVVLANNDIQKVISLFKIQVAKETEYVY